MPAKRKLLITGGAGFIGSELGRQCFQQHAAAVINVDALTYAGNIGSLAELRHNPNHIFEHVDITDFSVL